MVTAQIVIGVLIVILAGLVHFGFLTFGFDRWVKRWPKWLQLFLAAALVLAIASLLVDELWHAATEHRIRARHHGMVTLQDQPGLFWFNVAIDIVVLLLVPMLIVLSRWLAKRSDKRRVGRQFRRARDLPDEAIRRSVDDR